MKKYMIDWTAMKANPNTDSRSTANTIYKADGFKIWKGKRHISYGVFYTADEWHLVRASDGKNLADGKTAKSLKDGLEHALRAGVDIYHDDHILLYGDDAIYDDEFNVIGYKPTRAEKKAMKYGRRKGRR